MLNKIYKFSSAYGFPSKNIFKHCKLAGPYPHMAKYSMNFEFVQKFHMENPNSDVLCYYGLEHRN